MSLKTPTKHYLMHDSIKQITMAVHSQSSSHNKSWGAWLRSRMFVAFVCVLGFASTLVWAQNPPTANIYGIHGWAGDANTLLNGKGAYSVDLIYSDSWASDANYRTSIINSMSTA